jgi:DNA-binding NarL/FixJ family response regulator
MPIRVLIVDDVAATRALVRSVLEESPLFEVVGEANNGDGGVQVAAKLQPDLVLLDLRMPFAEGPGALLQIREVASASQVVILSGMAQQFMEPLFALGAFAVVPKGLLPDELLLRIEDIVESPEFVAGQEKRVDSPASK